LQLVVIPDLTKLSLAALRACVALMGADTADLQRHGQNQQWQPQLCWLAGCSSNEIGMVSPHLLDRFAMRMSGKIQKNTQREGELRQLLDRELIENHIDREPLSSNIIQTLQAGLRCHPPISDAAIARTFNYISPEICSHRREIALSRLAVAIARLDV
jgi:magnesium chelatase subunit D